MALHRRGGIYHYHFWVDGTRYRGSTKKANLAGGPASAQAARKGPSTAESVCRAPEKDTVDEYFLYTSAASQQEQTAGPGAWDQIRAREGIVAVFHL